jgi:DNA-binding NtrC family response regulator
MLLEVDAALRSSSYERRGRILRGVIHLHPGERSQRFFMLSAEAARVGDGLGGEPAQPFVASGTAFRAVSKHRRPVFIDVTLGTLQVHGTDEAMKMGGPASAALAGAGSQIRFLGRNATHVAAFPVQSRGSEVAGMVSLEADCVAATGVPFVWTNCAEKLQNWVDDAALALGTLPSRPAASEGTDELLPVVGPSMAGVVSILRIFARQEETVLLTGPTGAGKSRLARWCHEQSERARGPFEVLSMVTIPEELQLAELFGWRRGAFTGAVRDSSGSVERAEGGTLFLDEIDKLSLRAQGGLLQLLEERKYRSLGEGAGERIADVRFIVASNVSLEEAVRAGDLREDLYYRLNVLPVRVPPLSERIDEIEAWARHMLARRSRSRTARFSPQAMVRLSRTPWPGNLRQLDNIVRRAFALALGHPPESEIVVEEVHVRQALTYEGLNGRLPPLVEALEAAARAYVLEAQRRGRPLDLEFAAAFQGFVLGTAIRELGQEQAFKVLGKESLVRNRNTRRTIRMELTRVEALCRALGMNEAPFSELAGPDEDDD